MKKIISIVLLCTMLLACFAGCGAKKGQIALNNDVEMQNLGATVDWDTVADWEGGVDTSWYGDGSAETFYLADGADLRGFLVKVRTDNVTFENKTIELTANIDLGGEEWAPIVSDNADAYTTEKDKDNGVFFCGKFDGKGFTIGNFTMTLTETCKDTNMHPDPDNDYNPKEHTTPDAVGGHALLGSIAGNAEILNLNVVGATYIANYTSQASNVIGGIVAEVNTYKGQTVKLINLSVSGTITNTAAKTCNIIGGVVAKVKGGGNAEIKECTDNMVINAPANQQNGGIVGTINSGVLSVLIRDCTVTANITGSTNTGGILGQGAQNAKDKKLQIINCNIPASVTVTSNGHQSGGVAGLIAKNTTVIKDCEIKATLNFPSTSGQVGGMVGTFQAVQGTIKNCTFDGTMTGDRSCGGLVGSTDGATNILIDGCQVKGTLTFDIKGTKNLGLGGIVGLGRATSFTISNTTMAATMNATLNNNGAAASYSYMVGGLIGAANDSTKANALYVLYNNNVTGTLNIDDKDETTASPAYTDTPDYAGVLVGFSAAGTTFQFGNNVIDEATVNATGIDVPKLGGPNDYNYIEIIGHQTTEVTEGKYDLRFVAAADGDIEALGFIANIKYYDGEGNILGDKLVTEYVKYVYNSIQGGGQTYRASDYEADYLFTLTVKGIPEAYTPDNMGIHLRAIGADVVEGEGDAPDTVTYLRGSQVFYGNFKTGSKNDVEIDDAPGVPLASTLEAVAGKATADISKDLEEYTNDGTYYSGVAVVNEAVYPSTNAPYELSDLAKAGNIFTCTFDATVAGQYDIVLELRVKDNAAWRATYMYINDQDGYYIHYAEDMFEVDGGSYDANNENNANSRFVKIGTCYLNEGRNTVTFKIDTEISGVMHPRTINFIAK